MAPSSDGGARRPSTTLYSRQAASGDARERLIMIAYDLFSREGICAVGVDRVIAEAGIAKTTLYRHFGSKEELVLEVLARREERWTIAWLRGEVERRSTSPRDRLLAIFDVFGEWFSRPDYESCLFTNTLLETHDRKSRVGADAATRLENVRSWLCELAQEAGADDPYKLAHQIQILMLGAILSAFKGDPEPAQRARELAALLIDAP
jgi:AcrR family transcriptional regulator